MEIPEVIYELVKPGWRLDDKEYGNTDERWQLETLIRELEKMFFEANIALNLFNSNRNRPNEVSGMDKYRLEENRKKEIRDELVGATPSLANEYEELSFQVERQFKREQWQQGKTPDEFTHTFGFIYARVFLFALDNYEKILEVLINEKGAPQNLETILNEFKSFFPTLRDVRNSAHHKEDRIRGLHGSFKKKEIDFKPMDNYIAKAPHGKVQIGESLWGDKYGTSLASGYFGEIEVSFESMEKLSKIMNDVFNSFKWEGGKKILP